MDEEEILCHAEEEEFEQPSFIPNIFVEKYKYSKQNYN